MHGLKGEEIPLNARIIGIADAFDAMTANRVYRKKLDMDFVLGELKKAGEHSSIQAYRHHAPSDRNRADRYATPV